MNKNILSIFILIIFGGSLKAQVTWKEDQLLVPERSQFQTTSTHADVVKFLTQMQTLSKHIVVFSMGKSLEGRDIPVAVLANPAVKNAEEAKASGKMVLYIQGNIHAGEVEGKEAAMMLIRDILFGEKKYLLDHLIIIFVPIYNTDSNDKMAKGLRPSQEDSPLETGERESSEGYDLNRDGMKFDARETRYLFSNVIVPWDPQIFVDMHTTNGTWHAYSLTWAPSFHSCGEYSPFDYSYNTMLPAITEAVDKKYHLQLGPYGDYSLDEGWPLKNFYSYNHHPRYLVNQFGLRNRMAILSEAFAHERFYQRIHSTYSFVSEILEYAHIHHTEIVAINKKADEDAVQLVKQQAGKVKKGIRFKMLPLNKLNHFITYDYIPYTDSLGLQKYMRTGKIVQFDSIDYHAKFEATLESTVPNGYIIPAQFVAVIDNLKQHGIKVSQLDNKQTFSGEQFIIDSITHAKSTYQKHRATTLHGSFSSTKRAYKNGDYIVDMAQPLCNLIFYLLEPQSDDGLAYWNFFDSFYEGSEAKNSKRVFPVFKYYSNK